MPGIGNTDKEKDLKQTGKKPYLRYTLAEDIRDETSVLIVENLIST
jgi:hypothetical protein